MKITSIIVSTVGMLGTLFTNAHAQNPNELNTENYTTADGNDRYFRNPTKISAAGTPRVLYSIGATRSPFTNLEDMKNQTRVPSTLGETDFYVNYVNAKSETKEIVTDPKTGNRYYAHSKSDDDYTDYEKVLYENENFWNIQRFLIGPHYSFFKIKKKQARMDALFDMYKYFLYFHPDNRDEAWTQANRFIEIEVDPIVESKFSKWYAKNYYRLFPDMYAKPKADQIDAYVDYYTADSNWFSDDNQTSFSRTILNYNFEIFSGNVSDTPSAAKEIEELLTDYNIHFRKKDPETALKIAHQTIMSDVARFKKAESDAKRRPLTKFKMIKAPDYPAEYKDWDDDKKFFWRNDSANQSRFGVYQDAYTASDRANEISFARNHRYPDLD